VGKAFTDGGKAIADGFGPSAKTLDPVVMRPKI
jgi:hypothetical protein